MTVNYSSLSTDFQFIRGEYTSAVDGATDWYILHPGARPLCIVVLHGHGSHGDQLLTRGDLEDWRQCLKELDATVVSPNLRDNAWMSPAAVDDLADLLKNLKAAHPWRHLVIASGSMGATGALIFAIRHPELVDGVVPLGAATSLRSYIEWCDQPDRFPVIPEILAAIRQAYPTEEMLAMHDVRKHCDRLTMPVFFYHGEGDAIIPVSEALDLAEQMKGKENFHLTLIPCGGHDSPLPYFREGMAKVLTALGEPLPDGSVKADRA
ncbi:MAG: alpha/beta fold hydrolase [Victivallales bacterium]|nr:alpha/beta fold hydrolase [Victivallales bacterium]